MPRLPGTAQRAMAPLLSIRNRDLTLAGLEAVFLAHRDALLRFLHARGAGDDADDLLQELWFRVAAAPAGPIAEPVGYLMRAANNLMLDRHRGRMRAMRRDLDWAETATSADHEAPDAERALIGREALGRAEAVLASLGSRVEAIFRRYRLDEVTIDQVAREFGVSRSTVEKDLQKAYRALLELRSGGDA
jgi:RNA polymerase sigma-70 factor (ECF subfamily)